MPETTTPIATTDPVAEEENIVQREDLISETTTETIETTVRDYWTPENLMAENGGTVPIMGKGMLGIFLVMGLIILCVSVLNYFGSPDRKKKREEKKAAKNQANNNNKQ